MILKKITYTPYNIPFAKSFITAKISYSYRTGFILKITDELGNTAHGEAAPLANFGADTLSIAEKSLKKIQISFSGFSLSDDFREIKNFSDKLELSPTAHFAFDQCLLQLFFKRNQNIAAKIFPQRKLKLSVNYVVGFHPLDKTLTLIKNVIAVGFKTFKLKVGRDYFDEDLEILNAVKNKFDNSINIRLDVNGKWKLDEAISNISKIKLFNIQYIEQPVENISDLILLAKNVSLPVAPDECIKSFNDAESFIDNKSTKFIVIKPALLGSIFKTFGLIKKANEMKKIIIISSAIETAAGRSAVNFIASLTEHQFSHGLATAQLLGTDSLNDFYPIINGAIDISKYPPEFV